MKYKLTPEEVTICLDFAKASAPESERVYGASLATIRDNIYTGKAGEVAAHKYLQNFCKQVSPPDFNVYKGRRKSWAPDLMADGNQIHCKTQTVDSVIKYGISWILQHEARRKDALFTKRTKHDIFVGSVFDGEAIEIVYIASLDEIFDKGCIEMPKVKWLQNSKRAIYFESLKRNKVVNLLFRETV